MKDVTLTWDLPTTRESGLPVDPADVVSVDVSLSSDGGVNFVLLNTVLAAAIQTLLVGAVPIGDHIFRFRVNALVPAESSANLDVPVNVPDDSPLSTVLNVNVSLA